MSPSERRLEELTAIRRPLTDAEQAEVLRRVANVNRKERYWTDPDFRRREAERKRKYRNRGYR